MPFPLEVLAHRVPTLLLPCPPDPLGLTSDLPVTGKRSYVKRERVFFTQTVTHVVLYYEGGGNHCREWIDSSIRPD